MSSDVTLQEIDYELLEYISENQPVHIDKIKGRFSKVQESIEYRIEALSKGTVRKFAGGISPVENSSFILHIWEEFMQDNGEISIRQSNSYELTGLGYQALQDYNRTLKSKRKDVWLKNAWIPILVSIAMYLLLNAVLPLLRCILGL